MKAPQQPTHLSICLLGPFQVVLDGSPVTEFESDKARALLAYLAVESDRPLRRETLAGLFWPESPERSARTNLRSALKNVRRIIGDRQAASPCLLVSQQTLQFNGECDAWVDVRGFDRAVQAASSSGLARARIDHPLIDQLEEATAWYRGPFLEGFSLVDCPAFEEWALLRREQLQRAAFVTLNCIAAHYEAVGDFEQGLQHARRAANLDPWREEAQRQLMRLLALSGQRSAALAQYEACRRTLLEELGVEPEEETTTLFRRIKARELAPASAGQAAVPNNLPVPLTPFVGRSRELDEIGERLRDPTCRLLTVVGPGGIGKTRVAIQAAKMIVHEPRGRLSFPHGVFFVSLLTVGTTDALVPTIANALGFSFYEEANPTQSQHSQLEPVKQLFAYLRGKALLLVLDNFEHLLVTPSTSTAENDREDGAAAFVTEILTAAPTVKLLVTSREALNLQYEWRYPVAGMTHPSDHVVDADGSEQEPEDYSAVVLLSQCARRACPGFSLVHKMDAVVRICQLVEGMPLAIELSAAWLKALSPDKIVTELERGLDVLATTQKDVEPRHRSMRAVFDHSYGLLSESEQRVLRHLSVLRGFRLRAAQAVAGANMQLLAGLVEKSLLRMLPGGRYQMHELLRHYALKRLQDDPQEEREARDRHSEHFMRLAQVRGEALKGRDQQAALEEMEADGENVRLAWNWAVEQRRAELLDTALEGMCLYYERRLRFREGEEACRIAAAKLEKVDTGCTGRVLARFLMWQAAFCPLERAEFAARLLKESFCLLERAQLAGEDVRREKAFLFRQMGHRAFVSDVRLAKSLYEQSLAVYRALDDKWGTARVLEQLAWSGVYLGAYEDPIRWHKESLALRRGLGDLRGMAESYRGLAAVALLGQIEEGMQSVRQCIAIWRQLGDRAGIAGGLNQLAPGLILTGRFAEAFRVLEESLGTCSDLGLRWGAEWADIWLGFAELHVGRYDAARSRGEKALAFAREFDDYEYVGRSLLLLGDVALAVEAYAEALSFLQESVASYQAYGLPNELVWALADLAVAARGLSQSEQARNYMCQALRTAVGVRAVLSLIWIVPKTGLFLVDVGARERVVEVNALASRYPGVAESRWFEHVVGRHLAAVGSALPPEVVTMAWERGRAQDLEATAAELLVELGGKQ